MRGLREGSQALTTAIPCACFTPGFSTKLSSAGLVYKHFGREVVAAELALPLDDPRVETVYLKARSLVVRYSRRIER